MCVALSGHERALATDPRRALARRLKTPCLSLSLPFSTLLPSSPPSHRHSGCGLPAQTRWRHEQLAIHTADYSASSTIWIHPLLFDLISLLAECVSDVIQLCNDWSTAVNHHRVLSNLNNVWPFKCGTMPSRGGANYRSAYYIIIYRRILSYFRREMSVDSNWEIDNDNSFFSFGG